MDAPPTDRTTRPVRTSLAAGVTPELSADPAAFVEAAAAAGWEACGIWYDPGSWTASTTRGVRHALDATGTVALDLEVVRLGQVVHAPILDAARDLGARHVLCISMLDDPGATLDAFAALCADCAAAGIRACLEFMPFSTVRTLAEAVTIVDQVANPAAAVLVDTLHLVRSGGAVAQLAELARARPELLPYAQWCDGPAEPSGGTSVKSLIADALDGRSCPGEGELPTAEFAAALPAGTPLSLEIRSAALRSAHPDPVDRARAVLTALDTTTGPEGAGG